MNLEFDPSAFLYTAAALILVPAEWIASWFAAALLHEAGHLLVLWLVRGRVRSIRVGASGAVIRAWDMEFGPKVCSLLAGPGFGMLPAFFYDRFPKIAVCSIVFSAYNLLPLPSLDGGRILTAVKERWVRSTAICSFLEIVTVVTILFAAILFRLPLLLMPLIPFVREKLLAKKIKKGYNSATIEMR